MIKAFDLSIAVASHASHYTDKTLHADWHIGSKESDLKKDILSVLSTKGTCQQMQGLINKNNLNEEEASDLNKKFACAIKRCDSALAAAEYLAEVAQNSEYQVVDPRIVKVLSKLTAIQEKINSSEYKKLEDTKLGFYDEVLSTFNENQRICINGPTAENALKAKEFAKNLMARLERIELKNQILEHFNSGNVAQEDIIESQEEQGEVDGDVVGTLEQMMPLEEQDEVGGDVAGALEKMISLISSSATGEEVAKTTSELSKLDGSFSMNGEVKKENILHRIHYHLYHIHKNEEIAISGIEKSDFKYGEKVFGLSGEVARAEKLRAVQRVVVELLLSDLKDAIQQGEWVNALFAIKELERMALDTKDVPLGKNVAHILFEEQYRYCVENNLNQYDYNAPEWGYEFGRIAFVASDGELVSKEAKLAVLEKVITSLKQKWNN